MEIQRTGDRILPVRQNIPKMIMFMKCLVLRIIPIMTKKIAKRKSTSTKMATFGQRITYPGENFETEVNPIRTTKVTCKETVQWSVTKQLPMAVID